MRPLELTAFVLLGAVWGSAFLFIKWAAEEMPPFSLVAFRMTFALALVAPFVFIRCATDRTFRSNALATFKDPNFYWKSFVMGFFNNSVPFSLVAWGESSPAVNSGVAAILDSTIPFFSQILGHFLLEDERLTWRRSIGLFVGFGGVFAVCCTQIFNTTDDASTDDSLALLYYFMIIIASFSYGVASVFGKKCLQGYDSVLNIFGMMLSAFLINWFIALAWEYPDPIAPTKPHFEWLNHLSLKVWLSLLYLGVISTVVAYILFFYLLKTIGSVKQTMVGFLLPVFGLVLGILANNEWEDATWLTKFLECIGTLLIVAGVYFVTFSPASKKDEEFGEDLTGEGSLCAGCENLRPGSVCDICAKIEVMGSNGDAVPDQKTKA
eukprot:Nk52_evm29s358 gene=Nk52_evmTU29s358